MQNFISFRPSVHQTAIRPTPMLDLIFLLATIGFFFGSIAYAHWCGKI